MLNEKRAILILGALPPPLHGASLYYQYLTESKLLHNEFEIYFMNLNFGNTLNSYQKFALKKVIRAFLFLIRYIILLITKKVDIIYSAVSFPKYPFIKDSLFVILGRIFKKRIIGCILGTGLKLNYQASSLLMKKYYKLIGKFYYSFITPSLKMSQKDFNSVFPIERLEIVPFGTVPILNKKIQIDSSISFFNILYMSNFFRTKGIFDILKSIRYVIQKFTNVNFIFAGSWISKNDEKEAEKIIEEEKIGDYIEFVGLINNQKKKEILANSHIFVLPTSYESEGFPLAILDAMSCGHFIITTDHAGIGEVISHGKNGFFCKKGDPQDLAQKIQAAIEMKEFAFEVRSRNIEEFYNFYTHERYVSRLIQVINKYL